MLMLQKRQFRDAVDEEVKEERAVRMGGRMGQPVPGINCSAPGEDDFARLDRDAVHIGNE